MTGKTANGTEDKQNPGQLSAVQLNIVTFVDMEKVAATGTLEGALYMMDNGNGSTGQGTGDLQTVCNQGQVLNWIIRPLDMETRPDGSTPPMPKINNIVFLDNTVDGAEKVANSKVCAELKVYGMPDFTRHPLTPSYYYWAGVVALTVEPGVHEYRLSLELEQEGKKERMFLRSETRPSIRVLAV
ncbi:hypothetical protein ACGFNU_32850 [Spirillospora sp. NPDC048911]|uniref:hypothetical protein n=1 Tax=Spirillospora sp. NPDC048911 TaxID=3364527 RepID=UPI0037131D0B